MIARGIVFLGFTASSAKVLTASKPMKLYAVIAAPAETAEMVDLVFQNGSTLRSR